MKTTPPARTAPRIGLTLGDAAGIGPEVCAKALRITRLGDRADVSVFVAAALADFARQLLRGCGEGVRIVDVGPACPPVEPQAGLSDEAQRTFAFKALEAMVAAARAGQIGAMVTGPVPKAIFAHMPDPPPGQTEYVAAQLGAERFAMMLAGPKLRVVPVTTHVALRQVADLISADLIVRCAQAADETLRRQFGIARPRLTVCGLNPHAGEGGRFGGEELAVIAPAVARLQRLGIAADGPAVADTAFHFALLGRADAVICMYHDQALGPLKTVHFSDAINVTCGLPVLRVSPDHGTAYDIAGRGMADPTSTLAALKLAERSAIAAAAVAK